jgi:hypothetical protein
MSIQHTTAKNSTHADTEHDHEWPRSATVTGNSTLADAWLNGNREAVEGNTFFSLAIEPDVIVKVTPDLKRHKWMHRQPITH